MYRKTKIKKKRKRRVTYQNWKRQRGDFLNRHDFAYAGTDTVNQAAKVAPGIIKGATNDINNVAKQTID